MQKRYPFPFLDAYEHEDRDFFFGRDEEIETIYQLTQQSNIILLYGASGTGKTSLIRCGLSNKFKSYDWHDLYVRRGEHLIRILDKVLCEAADRDFDLANSDGRAITDLPQKLEAVYKTTFKPLYLIFDQFEELYTLGSKDEEQAFIATVRELLRVEQPVKIILSIREEYLGYLYEFERQVPELLRIEPMFSDRVQQVILGVGRHEESNVRLQAGEEAAIAARIFEKLRGHDKTLSIQLPYLQVLLDKYYLHCTGDESRQAEATFTLATLDTLGDLGDVLRNFLDEQVQHIARQLDQPVETLWELLSPFVTLDGTKEPLSETELRSRLPKDFPVEVMTPALQAFVQRRVLRYMEQTTRYEVAHDTLAKQLHARRSDEEIALLEVQRLIRSQVAIKAEAREHFSAKQLAFILEVLPKLRLVPEEKAWVEKSRRYREEEAQAEAERQRAELAATKRRLRAVRGLLVLALVAVAVAGYFGWSANVQKQVANAKTKEAQAAEKKATAVLDKIYFYEDRFGLAYDKSGGRLGLGAYGFIDEKLNTKIDFKYDEALSFEYTGYAKVKRDNQYFFIDTLGKEYLLVTEVSQLTSETRALDLRQKGLTEIPEAVFKNTELDILLLNRNQLSNLPVEIGELKNLTRLDLSDNQLSSLPVEIGELKNLKILSLASSYSVSRTGNQITSLPAEIGQLKNLTYLNLGGDLLGFGNQLSSLPVEIGELKNLTRLDLSDNQLSSLPVEIGGLENLTGLYLSGNPIPAAEQEKIRQWLPNCEIEF